MFFDELSPIFKEITQQPVAFFGGLVSGLLRLSLADDPVKSWLDQQTGTTSYPTSSSGSHNGNSPQSISID
ncbi:hypothetical protein C7B65_25025 [Phormidesmis priestleyi ULC007]|uniref:Uncharacterized protein n=1 Tax=Phormidesmis priestleyi ULC007 TaxID=1920490 RepID=A0A2T1D3Y6_9CYAN|nr:hypothetical protein [Phormidesmis priestleyi]PSB15189.1 hypothetical protein C7B65_25025 [Phormidesmis priestleyi ULC007]PZO46023.1 MAG: hypothetical protein DCF14_23980 [Phormidesmis priestleyi]